MNTLVELAKWMEEHCYSSGHYLLLGESLWRVSQANFVEIQGGRFFWYYTERGNCTELAAFDTEAELVAHIFPEISANKNARAHLVGLTSDLENSRALQTILIERGIEFTTSTQSYYKEKANPWHFVTIYGCDMKKAEDLLPLHFDPETPKKDRKPGYFKAF